MDTLVAKVQGVPGDDRCVLLLGYEEQMGELMRGGNPGLARRFQLQASTRTTALHSAFLPRLPVVSGRTDMWLRSWFVTP